MKLTISILFCVILTLQYNSANGEPKDLFGRIHESVTKVKQDVHNLFNSDVKKQQENQDESTNIHFEEEESQEDFAAAAAARKPAEVTLAPPTSTSTAAPVTTTAKNETEEEKDGRENFAGGCVPGYMRTPDGRCKPTF